jgi:hypothetical protein
VHKKQEDLLLSIPDHLIDAHEPVPLIPPRMKATTFLGIFLYYRRATLPGTGLADVATPEMVLKDPLCDCGVCARAPEQLPEGPLMTGVSF